eukprot:SAG31_NODE_430_length_15792_cov_15.908558_2_plen_87_part_00
MSMMQQQLVGAAAACSSASKFKFRYLDRFYYRRPYRRRRACCTISSYVLNLSTSKYEYILKHVLLYLILYFKTCPLIGGIPELEYS